MLEKLFFKNLKSYRNLIFTTNRKAEILDSDDESLKLMNQVIDTNFRGVIECTREAFRLMKKSDDYGLIININSITGHKTPILGVSLNVYGPTKYAVTAFNESVRLELLRAGNKKIRISVSLRYRSYWLNNSDSQPMCAMRVMEQNLRLFFINLVLKDRSLFEFKNFHLMIFIFLECFARNR